MTPRAPLRSPSAGVASGTRHPWSSSTPTSSPAVNASGRGRALASAPRRKGRPGSHLREPSNQIRDGSGAPSHALQVQLSHASLSRMLEVPGDRCSAARRRVSLPPGTRPQFRRHGARGPRLPAGKMSRPGEARARLKPVAIVHPRPQQQSTVRRGVEALAVGSLGVLPSQQLDIEDQNWACTKAAHPAILGAWNASTGDREHHHQGCKCAFWGP